MCLHVFRVGSCNKLKFTFFHILQTLQYATCMSLIKLVQFCNCFPLQLKPEQKPGPNSYCKNRETLNRQKKGWWLLRNTVFMFQQMCEKIGTPEHLFFSPAHEDGPPDLVEGVPGHPPQDEEWRTVSRSSNS